MTQEQVTRRSQMVQWNRQKKRAFTAPHGTKTARQAELRMFVKQMLKESA